MGEVFNWTAANIVLLLITYLSVFINQAFSSLGIMLCCFIFSYELIRAYRRSPHTPKVLIPPTNRLVLLSSCDDGIGLQAAKRLDFAGFHIIACVKDLQSPGARDLDQFSSKRLRTWLLRSNNDSDLEGLIELIGYLTGQVQKTSGNPLEPRFRKPVFGSQDGELRLWALVHSDEQFRLASLNQLCEQPEILNDVMAPIKLTNIFKSDLIKAKGRVIHTFNITDRLALPLAGVHSMIQYSLRAYANALRNELKNFKVSSCVVEHFPYKIRNMEPLEEQLNAILSTETSEESKTWVKQFKEIQTKATLELEEVVDIIEDALVCAEPVNEYLCGNTKQRLITRLTNYLPISLKNSLIQRVI